MSESTASYPFPVMGPERIDYTSGCSYTTSNWSITSDHVELTHQVEGESLISHLIKTGKAGFGCVVVIPSTMYRFISTCKETGALPAKHRFEIEKKNRSIQIIRFLPVIFYMGESEKFIADSSMGVDEIWHGQEFVLQKGAVIARESWHHTEPGLSHLIKVKEGKHLKKGTMEVGVAPQDGGYFHVLLSSDLHKGFQKAKTQGKKYLSHRNSILTHALSTGLAKMAQDEKGDDANIDWDSLENFQALKQTLEEKHDMPLDTDFDPCKAACAYLPHCFDVVAENFDVIAESEEEQS